MSELGFLRRAPLPIALNVQAGKAQAGAEIAQRQDSAKQQPVSKAEDVVIEEKSQDKEPGQADSLPPPAEMPAQGLPYTVRNRGCFQSGPLDSRCVGPGRRMGVGA